MGAGVGVGVGVGMHIESSQPMSQQWQARLKARWQALVKLQASGGRKGTLAGHPEIHPEGNETVGQDEGGGGEAGGGEAEAEAGGTEAGG